MIIVQGRWQRTLQVITGKRAFSIFNRNMNHFKLASAEGAQNSGRLRVSEMSRQACFSLLLSILYHGGHEATALLSAPRAFIINNRDVLRLLFTFMDDLICFKSLRVEWVIYLKEMIYLLWPGAHALTWDVRNGYRFNWLIYAAHQPGPWW